MTEEPRPSPRRRVRDRVRSGAGRLRTELGDSVRALDERMRATTFVAATETVRIDVRRHAFVLAVPGLRTLAGTVALAAGPRLSHLLVFGVLTALWSGWRFRAGLRSTGITALAATAALAVLDALWGSFVCLLLLLLWALDDLAD